MRSPLSPSMFGLFSVLLDPEFEALFGGGVDGTVLTLLIGLALALLEPCTGLAGPLLPGSLLIPVNKLPKKVWRAKIPLQYLWWSHGIFLYLQISLPITGRVDVRKWDKCMIWTELAAELNYACIGSMVGCKAMHLSTRGLGACLSFPPPPLYKHTHHTKKSEFWNSLRCDFWHFGKYKSTSNFFLKPDIDVRISLKYFFSVLDHNWQSNGHKKTWHQAGLPDYPWLGQVFQQRC